MSDDENHSFASHESVASCTPVSSLSPSPVTNEPPMPVDHVLQGALAALSLGESNDTIGNITIMPPNTVDQAVNEEINEKEKEDANDDKEEPNDTTGNLLIQSLNAVDQQVNEEEEDTNDDEEEEGTSFISIPRLSVVVMTKWANKDSYISVKDKAKDELNRIFDTLIRKNMNPVDASHVSMAGAQNGLPGKFNLEKDDFAAFYTSYYSRVVLNDFQCSFVERARVNTGVKFYLDIDFDLPQFEHVLSVFDINQHGFYERLVAGIRYVLDMGESHPIVMSIRLPYKIHINCPMRYVSTAQAKADCLLIRDFFETKYNENRGNSVAPDGFKWDKIIDSSVYTSGLRLLGAKKRERRTTNQDDVQQFNNRLNTQVEIIHRHVYSIYDFDKQDVIPLQETTLDQFITTLIGASCTEEYDYMIALNANQPQVDSKTAPTRIFNDPTVTDQPATAKIQHELEKAKDLRHCNFITNSDLTIIESVTQNPFKQTREILHTVNDPRLPYNVLSNHFKVPVITANIMSDLQAHYNNICSIEGEPFYGMNGTLRNVKAFSCGIHLAFQMDSSYNICPFVKRTHNRSNGTNNNPVYVNIYSDGRVEMKCFNDECSGHRYPKRGPFVYPFHRDTSFHLYQAFHLNRPTDRSVQVMEKLFDDATDTAVAKLIYFSLEHMQADMGTTIDFFSFKHDLHRWTKETGLSSLISEMVSSMFKFFLSFKRLQQLFVEDHEIADCYSVWKKDYDEYDKKVLGPIKKKIIDRKLCSLNYNESVKKNVASMMTSDFAKVLCSPKITQLGQFNSFAELLDSNPHLLVFKNGVLELDTGVFRPGCKDDYCSSFLNYDYRPWKEYESNPDTLKYVQQIQKYFADLFLNPVIREYFIDVLARSLVGVPDERFYILYGNGSNGKSFLFNLLTKTFQTFGVQLPVTIFTSKRSDPSAANPELARLKAKRLALFQEPDEDDSLNVGLLKLLSGGDELSCRKLYKDTMVIRPQATFFLATNNLPKIKGQDGGTWRRIRSLHFATKFVDADDQTTLSSANRVVKTPGLEKDMVHWPPILMSFLCYRLTLIKDLTVHEPAEVLNWSTKQRAQNDILSRFINDAKVVPSGSTSTLEDLYLLYTEFMNNNQMSKKLSKFDFEKAIALNFGDASRVPVLNEAGEHLYENRVFHVSYYANDIRRH